MNDFLSICIPTYNRSAFLLQTLKAFLPQVIPLQIPIYISDNGSTDNTIEMITGFKNEYYPLIFFKTTSKNLGIDKNIADVVAMASSKYVWLFGDDDLPHAFAIERIVSNLDKDFKLIIVNASCYNSDFSFLIEERRVKIAQDRVYSSSEHEQFLIDTASYTGFLGGLVIEKKLWQSIPCNEYLGSDYLHVAVIFRYIVGHKGLFLAEPLIDIRLGGASWASRYFEVELINWPKTIWGLPAELYSDKTKNKICQARPTHSIKRMLATRAYGYYGRKEYERYISPDITLSNWKKKVIHCIIYLPRIATIFILSGFRCLQCFWGKPNLKLTFYRLMR